MRLGIAIALLIAVPGIGAAQFPDDVRAGARVRVWVHEAHRQSEGPNKRQLLRGTVESVDAGTVRVRIPGTMGSPLAIPRSTVRRLDVSRGVSRGASAVERGLALGIATAIWFGIANDPDDSDGVNFKTDWEAAGVGAALGAGFGAAFGLVWPYERWRRVVR
ncbi:MAG TPA: hypothetical protein VNO75_13505 [Gemmatimonadaceae bacterium]|nr:hypothetical protein [Gemmatimonadaceae bacterium]